jgi:hypothetical protein
MAPHLTRPANCSKDSSVRNLRSRRPVVQCLLRPSRYRNGANVAALANQVHNRPVSLPRLYIAHRQADQLRAAQAAPEQEGEHGEVPLLAHSVAA